MQKIQTTLLGVGVSFRHSTYSLPNHISPGTDFLQQFSSLSEHWNHMRASKTPDAWVPPPQSDLIMDS